MEADMLKQLKAAVGRVNTHARHRRDYAALLDLDDHILRDIGIDREEARTLAARRRLG
jgi:uncharacterized protein YjiS (DUF1127 family)